MLLRGEVPAAWGKSTACWGLLVLPGRPSRLQLSKQGAVVTVAVGTAVLHREFVADVAAFIRFCVFHSVGGEGYQLSCNKPAKNRLENAPSSRCRQKY